MKTVHMCEKSFVLTRKLSLKQVKQYVDQTLQNKAIEKDSYMITSAMPHFDKS
jgi:hypothetical protein